jgi:uncharacterized protein (TIGR03086 family)
MGADAKTLILLAHALDQTASLLDGVDPARVDQPTPCQSWTVQELVDHVVGGLDKFTAAAVGGERPDWTVTPARIGNDFGAAFRPGAARLVEAWRDAGDLDRVITLPIGERPASFVVNQQIAEIAVHGWDLAQATGQRTALDSEVAETALAWAKSTLLPQFRGPDGSGKPFGLEVAIADDAPAPDRLAAFFGRSSQR